MSDETGQSAIRSSTAKQIKEHVHSSKSLFFCPKIEKNALFSTFFTKIFGKGLMINVPLHSRSEFWPNFGLQMF